MNKRFISVSLLVGVMALVGLVGHAKGQDMSKADEHRSEVSKFVQDLTNLAGKDRNIGSEIKEIAKMQSEVASKSTEAIEGIDNRNSLVTFLFGTDYKRIGTLRSELVVSQNSIDRLTKAMERASSATVKADLQKQIDALNATVDKVNQFIEDNEDKFSLLGWAVKLFSGQ